MLLCVLQEFDQHDSHWFFEVIKVHESPKVKDGIDDNDISVVVIVNYKLAKKLRQGSFDVNLPVVLMQPLSDGFKVHGKYCIKKFQILGKGPKQSIKIALFKCV